MKLQRLLMILFYLQARDLVRAEELAGFLEVSRRTIYRDVEELRTAGAEIESVPGANGGFQLAAGFAWDRLLFSRDDLASVILSSAMLSRFRQTAFAAQAEELARRMERLCPEGTVLLRQRVLIDPEDRFPKGDLGARLVLLEKAVFSGIVVEIDYESPLCRTLSTRGPVDPYGLVNKAGYWFVVGYCHTLETYRAFNLVYIRILTSTDRTFVRDETFSLDEFWERVRPK